MQDVREISIDVGIVVRRSISSSRWTKWSWRVIALLPGAGPAYWKLLREEAKSSDYHAATLPMTLHRKETEAYRVALSMEPPSLYVIMRPDEDPDAEWDYQPFKVTASAFEAQDYADSSEELVEQVPAPAGLVAWIRDFVDAHHIDEDFKKRKRDRVKTELVEDGKGDPRIRQTADVYRAPIAQKPSTQKPSAQNLNGQKPGGKPTLH